MKLDKQGLVIGKFYPPHRGHKFLIDTARANVEYLTVLVCSKDDQSIPAETRAAWLREIHPGVTVMVVPDELDADDSRGWAESTIEWLGFVPDVVFTSETYGDAYAKFLGCKHVLVDRARACSMFRDDDSVRSLGVFAVLGALRPSIFREARLRSGRRVDGDDDPGAQPCRALSDRLGSGVRTQILGTQNAGSRRESLA